MRVIDLRPLGRDLTVEEVDKIVLDGKPDLVMTSAQVWRLFRIGGSFQIQAHKGSKVRVDDTPSDK